MPLGTAASDPDHPKILSDGAGSGMEAWQDRRSGGDDLCAQHTLASGTVDPA